MLIWCVIDWPQRERSMNDFKECVTCNDFTLQLFQTSHLHLQHLLGLLGRFELERNRLFADHVLPLVDLSETSSTDFLHLKKRHKMHKSLSGGSFLQAILNKLIHSRADYEWYCPERSVLVSNRSLAGAAFLGGWGKSALDLANPIVVGSGQHAPGWREGSGRGSNSHLEMMFENIRRP